MYKRQFHYLVKPFSDEKFEEVVKRAVRSIKEYSENQLDEKYMMVQSGGSPMKVFLKDIVYAAVYNRKVIITDVRNQSESESVCLD